MLEFARLTKHILHINAEESQIPIIQISLIILYYTILYYTYGIYNLYHIIAYIHKYLSKTI